MASERRQLLFSLIVAGLLSGGAYWCAISLAAAVAAMPK